jgi:phosphoribosylglycinamide formyltransferase 1
MKRKGRIAFFLSGRGSTLENLLARIDDGTVPGEIVLVLSDRPEAKGLDVARRRGIQVVVVDRRLLPDRAAFSREIEAALRPHGVDLVVLGGFLSIFRVPADLQGRILNVHPSLLPAFGGAGCWGERVQEAVLEAGVKVTGCTVHVVTDDVDAGPILDQVAVRVKEGDTPATLATRVQRAERKLYPKVIAAFLQQR